jgi:hypothetical protein
VKLPSACPNWTLPKRWSSSANADPAPRVRSKFLSSAGFKKMKNLKGGINAWAEEVDKSLPLY